MNVFVDDCEALEALPEFDERPGKASKDLMIYQDFVNQKYTQGKKVSSLNWHPTIHGKKTKKNKTKTSLSCWKLQPCGSDVCLKVGSLPFAPGLYFFTPAL